MLAMMCCRAIVAHIEPEEGRGCTNGGERWQLRPRLRPGACSGCRGTPRERAGRWGRARSRQSELSSAQRIVGMTRLTRVCDRGEVARKHRGTVTSAALEAFHSIGVGGKSLSGWCCHGVGERDHPADEQQPRLAGRRCGIGLRRGCSHEWRSTCAARLDGCCGSDLAFGSAAGRALAPLGPSSHGTRGISNGPDPSAVAVPCCPPCDPVGTSTVRPAGNGRQLCSLRPRVGAGLAEAPGQHSVRRHLSYGDLRFSQYGVGPRSISSRAISPFRGSPRLRERPRIDRRGLRHCCPCGHAPAYSAGGSADRGCWSGGRTRS